MCNNLDDRTNLVALNKTTFLIVIDAAARSDWSCTEDLQWTNFIMLYVTNNVVENTICDCNVSLITDELNETLLIGNSHQTPIDGNLTQQISIGLDGQARPTLYFTEDDDVVNTPLPLFIHTGKHCNTYHCMLILSHMADST